MDKVNMVKKQNRRGFFRIYEEANLFYKKIDEQQVTETQPVFDNILNSFSLSTGLEGRAQGYAESGSDKKRPTGFEFKENDTRNVNISASGIAFTCEEALREGDYLAIKILLASGIKDIVTYAKIVYCKSNQESDSQYPYFVGAHFVNVKDEDRDALVKHVDKKRLQQTWINAFILAAVITVIAAPGAVFGLLFELIHFLFELFLESVHLGFEFIESNLDHLIEHLFETDLHQTQVIVFYIIFAVIVYGLYRLWLVLPRFYRRRKKNQIAYWSRIRASLIYYWRERSLLDKIKLAVIGIVAIAGYIFFGM